MIKKTSINSRKPASTKAAGVQAASAAAKRVSRKRAAPATSSQSPTQKVFEVTARGFTVYTSPVRPVHRTREQIAAAIAALD